MKAIKVKRGLRFLVRGGLVLIAALALAIGACGDGGSSDDPGPGTGPGNGISQDDVDNAYKEGYEEGLKAGEEKDPEIVLETVDRVVEIIIKKHPTNPSYEGAAVDLTGLVADVRMINGKEVTSTKTATAADFSVNPPVAFVTTEQAHRGMSNFGDYRIQYTGKEGVSVAQEVNVYIPTVIAMILPVRTVAQAAPDDDSIPSTYPSISGTIPELFEDQETLDVSGLTFTGFYADFDGIDNLAGVGTVGTTTFITAASGGNKAANTANDIPGNTGTTETSGTGTSVLQRTVNGETIPAISAAVTALRASDPTYNMVIADYWYANGISGALNKAWGSFSEKLSTPGGVTGAAGDPIGMGTMKSPPIAKDVRAWSFLVDPSYTVAGGVKPVPKYNWRAEPASATAGIPWAMPLWAEVGKVFLVDRIEYVSGAEKIKWVNPDDNELNNRNSSGVSVGTTGSIRFQMQKAWLKRLEDADIKLKVIYRLDTSPVGTTDKTRQLTMQEYVKAMYRMNFDNSGPLASLPIPGSMEAAASRGGNLRNPGGFASASPLVGADPSTATVYLDTVIEMRQKDWDYYLKLYYYTKSTGDQSNSAGTGYGYAIQGTRGEGYFEDVISPYANAAIIPISEKGIIYEWVRTEKRIAGESAHERDLPMMTGPAFDKNSTTYASTWETNRRINIKEMYNTRLKYYYDLYDIYQNPVTKDQEPLKRTAWPTWHTADTNAGIANEVLTYNTISVKQFELEELEVVPEYPGESRGFSVTVAAPSSTAEALQNGQRGGADGSGKYPERADLDGFFYWALPQ